MNIEVRTQGKKKKYYLAHSFREGKKIRKIRRYLGSNLSEKQLEILKNRAQEIILQQAEAYKSISDPLKQVLTPREILLLKHLEVKGKIRVKHLSEQEWQKFTELFTYNTNAIEGSEVNQKEVKEILEEDKWPDKSKADIAETYGVNEAIAFIRETKEHISIDLINKIHQIVFKNSKSFAGQLRKKGEEVVVKDGYGTIVHMGAPQSRIVSLLEELIKWYNKYKDKYPALILAAVVHNQFENIHPFGDGNGRVGRILLNNILLKHNLPPMNIDLKNRREYYACLQVYEKRHDLKPTINLFIKEYKNLNKVLKNKK